jgi:hypothetical protein
MRKIISLLQKSNPEPIRFYVSDILPATCSWSVVQHYNNLNKLKSDLAIALRIAKIKYTDLVITRDSTGRYSLWVYSQNFIGQSAYVWGCIVGYKSGKRRYK